jgi:hypothetical protein
MIPSETISPPLSRPRRRRTADQQQQLEQAGEQRQNADAAHDAPLHSVVQRTIVYRARKTRVRVFKTKRFARFAQRERITDGSLCEAVQRAERGLIDADLGGGVIKQRVARPGQGRSGGYRLLVAYRARSRSVFLFGFAKSDRDNIEDDELATLRDIAADWLEADGKAIARAITEGKIMEVPYGKDEG